MNSKAISSQQVAQVAVVGKPSVFHLQKVSRLQVQSAGKARLVRTAKPPPKLAALGASLNEAFYSKTLLTPDSLNFSPTLSALNTPTNRSAIDLPRYGRSQSTLDLRKELPPLPTAKELPPLPAAETLQPSNAYERTRARISDVFSSFRPVDVLRRRFK